MLTGKKVHRDLIKSVHDTTPSEKSSPEIEAILQTFKDFFRQYDYNPAFAVHPIDTWGTFVELQKGDDVEGIRKFTYIIDIHEFLHI